MGSGAHVAFVGPYPPARGGIAQHSAGLVAALEACDIDVEIISWRSQYPRLLYPGSQASAHGHPSTHFLRWWSPLSWLRARRKLRHAELVVFPWVSPVQAIPLKIVLGGATGRVVAVVHNVLPHEKLPLATPASRWMLRKVDGIVVHADAVADQVRALTSARIEVVEHPPNIDIQPKPLPPLPTTLLFFGYIRKYKGVDLLIECLAILRSRGCDIATTIAGECWENPTDLIELAGEHGVSDLIDFQLGYVPNQEVAALLHTHHIIVQPYRSASQSGVIPLAFAAGRPVVVTPVGGLAEAVDPDRNGVVAEAADPMALADAILSATAHLESLAQGAAESAPSWARVAAAVLEVGTPP